MFVPGFLREPYEHRLAWEPDRILNSNPTSWHKANLFFAIFAVWTAARLHAEMVTLNWADNSDNECGFIIERSVNGGGYELFGETGTDEASFEVEMPPAGSAYTYRVCAWNFIGRSGFTSVNLVQLGLAEEGGVFPSLALSESFNPDIQNAPPASLISTSGDFHDFSYQWYRGVSGDLSNPIPGATGKSLQPEAISGISSYWVRLVSNSNPGEVRLSQSITISLMPVDQELPLEDEGFTNFSVRGSIDSDSKSMILGMVLEGQGSKKLLFRGIGPSLIGVSNPIADPKITVLKLNDQFGVVSLAVNDDWYFANNSDLLATSMELAGASPLLPQSKDAALQLELNSGLYAVILENRAEEGRTFLLEAYDLDAILDDPITARVGNISSRNYVDNGEDVLIAGFVFQGAIQRDLLIRVVGQENADVGSENWISDPLISLYKEGNEISQNDDWDTNFELVNEKSMLVGAFPLVQASGSSAISEVLGAGVYGAVISKNSGQAGVALFELYDVPREQM